MAATGSNTPSYDANGDVKNDYLNSYARDQYGRPTTVNSVGRAPQHFLATLQELLVDEAGIAPLEDWAWDLARM